MTRSTTRRRLLVVCPSAELYGADRVLLDAIDELVRTFDTTLCTPTPGPLVDLARQAGAQVIELPDYAIRARHLRPRAVLPWLGRVLSSLRTLRSVHRLDPFDVVYSGTLASGLGSLVRVLWRIPHVQHLHEFPYHGSVRRQVLLRSVQATSDRVLCNSEYVRRATEQAVPALGRRADVVYNGIGAPSPVSPRPDGQLRVACIARINNWKGQEVLVEAARSARDAGADWCLHFFGDALEEDRDIESALHRQIDAAGLADSVVFHGFVDDQDAVYADVDVVVIPSTIPEPFGMTAIEAQGRGLPVVATAPGGPAESVVDGETGFLVAHGDAHGLEEAIRRLEDPELRRRMGEAGRARVLERFSRRSFSRGVAAHLADVTLGDRRRKISS